MNNTLDLIHKRRSIRSFEGKSVDPEVKEQIVSAAMRAPTAGNMMLYSMLEVTDQNIKDKLVQSCDNQPFIAKSPFILLFLADYQRWYDYFLQSDVEGFCRERSEKIRTPGEGDLMLACCDALIAAQTAVIAAESLGLGSCYIGDIMENFEFHRDLFKLPQYTFPVAMLCIGYPTQSALERPLTSRFDKAHIVHTDTYKKAEADELADMFATVKPRTYLGTARNTGQHFYARKFGAEFSVEMSRSVKKAIQSWTEGEDS